jgi:hypothetical protein
MADDATRGQRLITKHREQLDSLTHALLEAETMRVSMSGEAPLGMGFGTVRRFPGRLRVSQGRVERADKPGDMQGKRSSKRLSRIR